MADGLPWYRCKPGLLLGALSGMEPHEGYVYVILLNRIYENGGPVYETARTLARRSGLQMHRVRDGLARLKASGRIVELPDGLFDSRTTHDELAYQQEQRGQRSQAGMSSAAQRDAQTKNSRGRAEKTQQKQRIEPTAVDQGGPQSEAGKTASVESNTDTQNKVSRDLGEKTQQKQRSAATAVQRPLTDKDKDKERESISSCVVPSGRWPDGALEQFLSVYPEHTKLEGAYGLKRQWINLQAALASRYAWETVMAGVRDYVANKPDHQPWMMPITFIQEERFMDRRAAKPVKPARAPKPDRSKNGFGALRSKTHQRGSEQSGAAPDDNQPGEEGYRSPFDDGSCIEGEAVEIQQQAGPPAHGPVHHRKP